MSIEQIRTIVLQHGRLSCDPQKITTDANLYELGLTSLTTVNLMLALEEHFDVEFPQQMLSRKTFESIRALSESIGELKAS
jgi:acyl carrier protein